MGKVWVEKIGRGRAPYEASCQDCIERDKMKNRITDGYPVFCKIMFWERLAPKLSLVIILQLLFRF